MKRKLRFALMGLLLVAVILGCPAPGGGGTKTYNIGDTGPAGGLIFYDQGSVINGWRYLEAAPYDQSTGIDWETGNTLTTATGTAVGTGKANTAAIVSALGAGTYAAELCQNLSLNGFSDWYLPAEDELTQIYQNLVAKGLGNFDTSTGIGTPYFSSTQASTFQVCAIEFAGNTLFLANTSDSDHVRAIRQFAP